LTQESLDVDGVPRLVDPAIRDDLGAVIHALIVVGKDDAY
jgi:hypothetical protein